jgi:hypothetical protein
MNFGEVSIDDGLGMFVLLWLQNDATLFLISIIIILQLLNRWKHRKTWLPWTMAVCVVRYAEIK